MLEQSFSKINFIGEDGFHWFIGQVTADEAWRGYSIAYGYRAKVRILGRHPSTNEVPDSELPWAHFLLPPSLGSGTNSGGTSFALQGGETVIGFFLDGEDMQQPIVLGSLHSADFIPAEGVKAWNKVISDESSGFKPIAFNNNLKFGMHHSPVSAGKIHKAGVIPDENNEVRDDDRKPLKAKLTVINDEQRLIRKAKACTGSAGFMSDVAKALASFTEIVGGLQKTVDGFIDPILNQIYDIKNLVKRISKLISRQFAKLIRLARKFMFEKIYKLVEQALGFLIPDNLLKDIAIKKSIDGIYCVIENIIKGLGSFISDFLMGLIGKVVNLPLCAAEQAIAGLMSNLTNKIQGLIGPSLNGIMGILGPIGSFMGFMNKAMGYAQMGLNFLSCQGQECDTEPYDWATNFGPSKKSMVDFQRAINISSQFSKLDVGGKIEDFVDGIFPTGGTGSEDVAALVGDCSTDAKLCGPPKIEIFGGGGVGAAANAVINSIGQVVGVNMKSLGLGYKNTPFVTIIDNCDNGRGATARAVVEDEKVVDIIIELPGGGYLGPDDSTGTDEGTEVVGTVDDGDIINTGVGYTGDDTITTGNGDTFKPIVDDDGRIIGMENLVKIPGVTDFPTFTINSDTGYGAIIQPIVKFTEPDKDLIIPEGTKVLTVIDCV